MPTSNRAHLLKTELARLTRAVESDIGAQS